MPFTFKKYIPTGIYRSFEKDSTYVKIKRKQVGLISEIAFEMYRIDFAVKKESTKNDSANFKWIRLKFIGKSEQECRTFLNSYFNEICEKYDLYYFED